MYRVKSESGPDHRKRFLVEVRLKPAEGEPGKPLARGMGSTKKHAEQDAARQALVTRLDQDAARRGLPGARTAEAAGGAGSRMSTPAQATGQLRRQPDSVSSPHRREVAARKLPGTSVLHLPTVPEALASLLRTVVVALFLLTFVLQPFLIPSESMEHTLLVGDFLLVNKQIFAPAGRPDSLSRWLLPYRDVERGDIVVFHHAQPAIAWSSASWAFPATASASKTAGSTVNGVTLDEPYAAFEPRRA